MVFNRTRSDDVRRWVLWLGTVIVFAPALTGCESKPAVVPVAAETKPEIAEPELEPVPTPAEAETDSDALKKTLLGLNEPEPEPVAEPESEPAPEEEPKRKRRVRRQEAKDPLVPQAPVGGLSDGEFNYALSDWRGVNTCLKTATIRGGPRNGAVRVAFTIQDSGSVRNAKVVSASNATAKALVPCVEKLARRVKFPSFEGPNEVEKTAKFVF